MVMTDLSLLSPGNAKWQYTNAFLAQAPLEESEDTHRAHTHTHTREDTFILYSHPLASSLDKAILDKYASVVDFVESAGAKQSAYQRDES